MSDQDKPKDPAPEEARQAAEADQQEEADSGSTDPSVDDGPFAGDDGEEGDEAGALALDDDVDHGEVLDAFRDYDSLDEESIGDEVPPPPPALAAGADEDDGAALLTPKERRLGDMRLEAKVEAIVFASQKPLKTSEILEMLHDASVTEADVQLTLDQLTAFYEDRCGGFRLHYLRRLGYQFQTAEAAGPIMERMFASRPRPISRAALETLAIIAYRQPVTRAEVEFIRGVDAGSIFKTLLERDLIKCVGRKEIVGRPMLFGTTDDFLKVFNLSSIKDLPPLESFQPSREMVQGALDKLDAGDSLVDVEEYIADNTGAEYESVGDEPALQADPDEAALSFGASREGARAEGGEAAEPPVAEAYVIPEPTQQGQHGTDQDTEVALPPGAGLAPRGGDLDQ